MMSITHNVLLLLITTENMFSNVPEVFFFFLIWQHQHQVANRTNKCLSFTHKRYFQKSHNINEFDITHLTKTIISFLAQQQQGFQIMFMIEIGMKGRICPHPFLTFCCLHPPTGSNSFSSLSLCKTLISLCHARCSMWVLVAVTNAEVE